MAKKKNTIGDKVVTPFCRFSYVHVFDTVKNMQGAEIYELSMIFPKKDFHLPSGELLPGTDMSWAKRVMGAVKKKCYPNDSVMNCIKDGDRPNSKGNISPENVGSWVLRAWTKEAPGIRDAANKNDIINPADFYSGCWGRATITPFIYDNIRGIGYSFFLNNIQKKEDDTSLAGSSGPAKNDFEPLASAADDADNFDNSSELFDESGGSDDWEEDDIPF